MRNAAEPIAIVAGGGTLPLELRDSLAAMGRPAVIITIRGFADRATRACGIGSVDIVDPKGLLRLLERASARELVLAGTVRRPSGAAVLGLFSAARNRAELKSIIDPLLASGDDGLLRGVVAFLEGKGHVVRGVTELAPHLLAPLGPMGIGRPAAGAEAAIATGRALLDTLSTFDIGQAAVVRAGRVLGIEGPEGTDRMLMRVAALNRSRFGFLKAERPAGGVLIKRPKTGQDLRVDLPAIGPRTVERAKAAGLEGIAVAAGLTLVLERQRTIDAANAAGLFLLGV